MGRRASLLYLHEAMHGGARTAPRPLFLPRIERWAGRGRLLGLGLGLGLSTLVLTHVRHTVPRVGRVCVCVGDCTVHFPSDLARARPWL